MEGQRHPRQDLPAAFCCNDFAGLTVRAFLSFARIVELFFTGQAENLEGVIGVDCHVMLLNADRCLTDLPVLDLPARFRATVATKSASAIGLAAKAVSSVPALQCSKIGAVSASKVHLALAKRSSFAAVWHP